MSIPMLVNLLETSLYFSYYFFLNNLLLNCNCIFICRYVLIVTGSGLSKVNKLMLI